MVLSLLKEVERILSRVFRTVVALSLLPRSFTEMSGFLWIGNVV